jgi:hypothetical protein
VFVQHSSIHNTVNISIDLSTIGISHLKTRRQYIALVDIRLTGDLCHLCRSWPVPVAAQSKVRFCDRMLAGVAD